MFGFKKKKGLAYAKYKNGYWYRPDGTRYEFPRTEDEIKRGVYDLIHDGSAIMTKIFNAYAQYQGKEAPNTDYSKALSVNYPPKTEKDFHLCLYREIQSEFYRVYNLEPIDALRSLLRPEPSDIFSKHRFYSITDFPDRSLLETDRLHLSDSYFLNSLKDYKTYKNSDEAKNPSLEVAYSIIFNYCNFHSHYEKKSGICKMNMIETAWKHLCATDFYNVEKRNAMYNELLKLRDTLYVEFRDWADSLTDEEIIAAGKEQFTRTADDVVFENRHLNERQRKFIDNPDDTRVLDILKKYVPAEILTREGYEKYESSRTLASVIADIY